MKRARNRSDDLRKLVLDVSERLSCEQILITRGAEGTLAYTAGEGFCSVPALAVPSAVVDRVGAGDSVLAVSSLCVARRAPMEIVGLVANAVGSQAIATVGNRTATQKATLFKYIESLVK